MILLSFCQVSRGSPLSLSQTSMASAVKCKTRIKQYIVWGASCVMLSTEWLKVCCFSCFPMKQHLPQNTEILYGVVEKRKAKVRFLSQDTFSEHGALSHICLEINLQNSTYWVAAIIGEHQFSSCGLWPLLGGWTTLPQRLPKTIGKNRYFKFKHITVHKSRELQSWSRNNNNFMVEIITTWGTY